MADLHVCIGATVTARLSRVNPRAPCIGRTKVKLRLGGERTFGARALSAQTKLKQRTELLKSLASDDPFAFARTATLHRQLAPAIVKVAASSTSKTRFFDRGVVAEDPGDADFGVDFFSPSPGLEVWPSWRTSGIKAIRETWGERAELRFIPRIKGPASGSSSAICYHPKGVSVRRRLARAGRTIAIGRSLVSLPIGGGQDVRRVPIVVTS